MKLSFAKNPARDKWERNIELLTAQFAELRQGRKTASDAGECPCSREA